MQGNLTNTPKIDNPDDTSLSDSFLTITPGSLTTEQQDTLEFIRGISQFLIMDALDRGETDIDILDVYVKPDLAFFQENPGCPYRFTVDEKDLMEADNAELLMRYADATDASFRHLLHQQPVGMFMQSIKNMLDIYSLLNKNRNGVTTWAQYRKAYIDLVAPACFHVFPAYMTAKEFVKTTSLHNLAAMASPTGVIVDESVTSILPRAQRRNIARYLAMVPEFPIDVDIPDDYVLKPESMDFHGIILNGLRNISAARII